MANIQISEELFLNLVKFHLYGNMKQSDAIKQELNDKLNKMLDRELYSQYKTAKTQEEREQARQDYLDRKGITKDFRW